MLRARTLLFVPANKERMLAKAAGLPADALIFDLEDSVPPAARPEAREMVRAHAPLAGGNRRVWVRVNALEDGGADDLAAAIGVAGVAGILIPKIETAAAVAAWTRLLDEGEAAAGLPPGDVQVLLNIESALAVLNAYDMASASNRVASLCFGGARDGDLNSDLGCSWSQDGPEMLHARQHTLLAARAARIACPLDGVFADIRDADGFRADTALSRRLGYRGRQVVHPDQIEAANALYAPSERELDYARRVIAAFDAAVAAGSASITVDDRLVDQAMAMAAKRLLAQVA